MSDLVENPEDMLLSHDTAFTPERWHSNKLSLVVRKPAFCICENKDADQLRGDREADQRLCFRYIDSTILLLPKYRISSLWPFSEATQPGLCGTWSETRRPVFSQRDSANAVWITVINRVFGCKFCFKCIFQMGMSVFATDLLGNTYTCNYE